MVKMLNIKPEEENQNFVYRGFWNTVNNRPDNFIKMWASDWNKDHWGFYFYVNTKTHEQTKVDLVNAMVLIDHINFVGGDVYIEFIDHSIDEKSTKLYKKLYDDQSWYLLGQLTRWV